MEPCDSKKLKQPSKEQTWPKVVKARDVSEPKI